MLFMSNLLAIKIDNIYGAVYQISLSKCLARDIPTVKQTN